MSETDTRRAFLKHSSAALSAAPLISALASRSYAAGSGEIKLALIGCGGRGVGAAQDALATSHPIRIVALADAFPFQIDSAIKSLAGPKVDAPRNAASSG